MTSQFNRIETVIELDGAIDQLNKVREQLVDMACTYGMSRRVDLLIIKLEDLRIDIMQADLPGEKEVIFRPDEL